MGATTASGFGGHNAVPGALHRHDVLGAHTAVFVSVSLTLMAVWLLVFVTIGEWFPWPVIPIGVWGAGLAAHALAVRRADRAA